MAQLARRPTAPLMKWRSVSSPSGSCGRTTVRPLTIMRADSDGTSPFASTRFGKQVGRPRWVGSGWKRQGGWRRGSPMPARSSPWRGRGPHGAASTWHIKSSVGWYPPAPCRSWSADPRVSTPPCSSERRRDGASDPSPFRMSWRASWRSSSSIGRSRFFGGNRITRELGARSRTKPEQM
jgi:hypothetical protein